MTSSGAMAAFQIPVDKDFDAGFWQGRIDDDSAGSTLRYHQLVRAAAEAGSEGVCLLGFASDEGVRRNHGRIGAAEGPAALRRALANLAVHEPGPVYDAGDITCTDGDLEGAQDRLAGAVSAITQRGLLPLVLGGGHEVAYGTWRGLTDALEPSGRGRDLLIINLDAHFDLREGPPVTSGTPFWQIATESRKRGLLFSYLCVGISEASNTPALVARARSLGVDHWTDRQLRWHALPGILGKLARRIKSASAIYLTIDLDVLPGEKAPGVSAPAACGVPLPMLEDIMAPVLESGKLVGADIAELNPSFDRDQLTARTAARLVDLIARSGARQV